MRFGWWSGHCPGTTRAIDWQAGCELSVSIRKSSMEFSVTERLQVKHGAITRCAAGMRTLRMPCLQLRAAMRH